MNITKIGGHDQKIDNDKNKLFEYDRKYNKYYYNDEH